MKVRDRVCDICGESVYKHRGCMTYRILKHDWYNNIFPRRVDLCRDCYKGLEKYIKSYNFYGETESSECGADAVHT